MRRGAATGLGLVLSLALATPAAAQKRPLTPAAFSIVPHDANDVFLRVSNRGGIGLSVQAGDAGNFPRGTPNRYLFGGGLWIGAVGDVDGDGGPDTLTAIGNNPNRIGEFEWVEGVPGFDRDDARFLVLDSREDLLFPDEPVADQELFAIYSDRFALQTGGTVSNPIGLAVRQRSFAFDDPGLASAILFQWDVTNIAEEVRGRAVPLSALRAGVVLDPDIGAVQDDTAAPLVVDGTPILLVWDVDFTVDFFQGRPGFFAVVPLAEPTDVVATQLGPLAGGAPPVPLTDAGQYRALAGLAPEEPFVGDPGFDLRALVGWAAGDLAPGATRRVAAAFVWAEASGTPPEVLLPDDPDLDEDLPVVADLVAAVRAVRTAYAGRVAPLPTLLQFPGSPEEPEPGRGNAVFQNFPNPFDSQTTVVYSLAADTDVLLEVLDVTGRRVATLVDGSVARGQHTTVWDGLGDGGGEAPAGVYVIRLVTPEATTSVRALKRP